MRAVGNQPGHPLRKTKKKKKKLCQFKISFSPSSPQLLRSFGNVASKFFSPDV
jgi:hypothetical protein